MKRVSNIKNRQKIFPYNRKRLNRSGEEGRDQIQLELILNVLPVHQRGPFVTFVVREEIYPFFSRDISTYLKIYLMIAK